MLSFLSIVPHSLSPIWLACLAWEHHPSMGTLLPSPDHADQTKISRKFIGAKTLRNRKSCHWCSCTGVQAARVPGTVKTGPVNIERKLLDFYFWFVFLDFNMSVQSHMISLIQYSHHQTSLISIINSSSCRIMALFAHLWACYSMYYCT